MFAQARFFDFSRFAPRGFQSRMRTAFEPRKPRHRLLRFVFGLVGLSLLVLLVMFGLVVGAVMLGAGLLYRLWARRGKPIARAAADAGAIDVEFRVVAKPTLTR